MTAPLDGHPITDIRAILGNDWFDPQGNPVELPYIYQSEVRSFTYDFGFSGLTSSERSALRSITEDAFALIESFSNVTFTEGFSADHFDIDHVASRGSSGWASWSAWDWNGNADIDQLSGRAEIGTNALNPYLIYHEIGHLMTLEHTGPRQNPEVFPFLEAAYRNNNYTVMHYDEGGSGQADGMWDYRSFGILDVYALQLRFGANTATFAGDDTHDAASLWGENEGYLVTLWDAGGRDRLDFGGTARDQLIDLREGRFSDAGDTPGAAPGVAVGDPLDLDYTQPDYNLAIAYGAEIEEAVGGAGDDVLFGNGLGNVLIGGDGNDLLYGDGPGDGLA